MNKMRRKYRNLSRNIIFLCVNLIDFGNIMLKGYIPVTYLLRNSVNFIA